MDIEIGVRLDDVLDFDCDVLVLKYAQARFGADEAVAQALEGNGQNAESMVPSPGGFRLIAANGAIAARSVMFAGVAPLREFGYGAIRHFSHKALEDLAGRVPGAAHVAFTMHGAGYGLDEREAFESLVAGILDAIRAGDVPGGLASVSVVERNPGRARRLTQYLSDLLVDDGVPPAIGDPRRRDEAEERLRDVGAASDSKPHVFVAMPFSADKSDLFHYGIEPAIRSIGLLCERIDEKAFTGDILDQIKQRIGAATLVVADLSGANPNVYLEVGYAWGKGIPTILIIDDTDGLKFDVQGQRCVAYNNIRDLEKKLKSELRRLVEEP